jgi:hypothetical protein
VDVTNVHPASATNAAVSTHSAAVAESASSLSVGRGASSARQEGNWLMTTTENCQPQRRTTYVRMRRGSA